MTSKKKKKSAKRHLRLVPKAKALKYANETALVHAITGALLSIGTNFDARAKLSFVIPQLLPPGTAVPPDVAKWFEGLAQFDSGPDRHFLARVSATIKVLADDAIRRLVRRSLRQRRRK